jgi:hypothetical protein
MRCGANSSKGGSVLLFVGELEGTPLGLGKFNREWLRDRYALEMRFA